jgi:WS/DGAT/MGAT family acyltransferase
MTSQRLSTDDSRILELERGPIAGHTLKVMVCDAPEEPGSITEGLRTRIAERIESVPRCRQRIETGRLGPAWADCPDFDPADQIEAIDAAAALDEEALRHAAASLMSQKLPRDRPLWRVDVAERLSDGGFALILRTHHAMADGITALRMARQLFWDQSKAPTPATVAAATSSPRLVTRALAGAREAAALPGAWRRELAPSGAESPFAGEVGSARELAFAEASLQRLHDIGKRVDPAVTLNDVVLTVCAGGMRRWLAAHGDPTAGLRAKVPVSLHNHDHSAHDLGNHDSFMCVDLPASEPDPVARLRAVHAETAERKNHHDPEALDAMLRALHETGAWDRAVERREMDPRVFTVNISNVPGPRDEISVFGGRMCKLMTIAEIGELHALRISVISASGRMFFGLCADPEIVPGLPAMAAGIESDIEALNAAARACP